MRMANGLAAREAAQAITDGQYNELLSRLISMDPHGQLGMNGQCIWAEDEEFNGYMVGSSPSSDFEPQGESGWITELQDTDDGFTVYLVMCHEARGAWLFYYSHSPGGPDSIRAIDL